MADSSGLTVEAAAATESPAVHRVGWGFISLYTLAYMSTCLLFLAPAAGHPGVEGQLARGDRTGAEQPGAGRRGRRPAVHGRQPVLRQAERPHVVAAGHAAALDGHRPGGRLPRHPRRRAGAQHRGRPRRMVHRPAVLQRPARRHGGGAARPGPDRSTRPGLRHPGGLPAHRVGDRHVPGQAVHRQPARHVPGAVRDRRVLHPALRGHAEGPPAGRGGQAGLVAARVRQHVLRRTRGRARTSPGRSPAASCSCWPTPS